MKVSDHIYSRSDFSFRLFVIRKQCKIDKIFSTLEEAIIERDKFILPKTNSVNYINERGRTKVND
jgi:hypothetical protein